MMGIKNSTFVYITYLIALLAISCGEESKLSETDITESDTSSFVQIGSDYWTTKNLNVSFFRNGDAIKKAKSMQEWSSACINREPAWCYYNFDSLNGENYGKLYNWFAIIDPRGLTEVGWHVATYDEWENLEKALFPEAVKKLKHVQGWDPVMSAAGEKLEDRNGSNDSRLRFLPSGYCNTSDGHIGLGSLACFWTSTMTDDPDYIYGKVYVYDSDDSQLGNVGLNSGLAVRCVRDRELTGLLTPPEELSETKIGNQIWSTRNLNVVTFRNGDTIYEVKTDLEWKRCFEDKIPAWCYYNNDSKLGAVYGKIYNYYAVCDTRGVAPLGWHIPSRDEIDTLIMVIGGDQHRSGKHLKTQYGWFKGNGDNSLKFFAGPGGNRQILDEYTKSTFVGLGYNLDLWIMPNEINSGHLSIQNHDAAIPILNGGIDNNGCYIRCIKD